MSALLTLRRNDILADIADAAFVVADVEEGLCSPHRLHQTFDLCEEENLPSTNRLIDLIFSEVTLKLLPLSGGSKPEYGEEFLHLHICLPSRVAPLLEESLRRAAHEYIVARVLEERLAITLPSSRGEWERKGAALSALISALASKGAGSRPVRRRIPGAWGI